MNNAETIIYCVSTKGQGEDPGRILGQLPGDISPRSSHGTIVDSYIHANVTDIRQLRQVRTVEPRDLR